ncbi:hypothetical protein ALC60_02255 [Trachymyrmex zeteki]|uniref:Uncharacterized protein n=1 Tax=Mycetomoellerius zeteki TaxID=64791 RepID=A0A151XE63_9HYME|nr:hypothetical protein ALC60_02255 [Trachymyrmex zeteki]
MKSQDHVKYVIVSVIPSLFIRNRIARKMMLLLNVSPALQFINRARYCLVK